jgi:arylsulfatase A-like enzyme
MFNIEREGLVSGPQVAQFFAIGLLVSAVAALVDTFRPEESLIAYYYSLRVAAIPPLVVAARTFLSYVLFVVAGLIVLRGGLKIDRSAYLFAVGMSVGALRVVQLREPEMVPASLLNIAAAAVLAAASTAAVYAAVSRLRLSDGARRHVTVTAFAGTLWLVEIWLFRWALDYGDEFSRFAVTAAYVALVFCTALPALLSGRYAGKWRAVGTVGLCCALAPAVVVSTLPKAHARTLGDDRLLPPVFFISIDTLRPDSLSCYNSGAARTPHIDSLAEDSVLFSHAVAPSSWTIPSMMSVMTGYPPHVHRAGFEANPFNVRRYPGPLPTLAELLRGFGYSTKAIVGNFALERPLNVVDGFDDYIVFERNPLGRSFGGNWLSNRFPFQFVNGGNTRMLTDLAGEWVSERSDSEMFLWLHYLDPHWPYAPPPEYFDGSPETLKWWSADIDEDKAISGERKFSKEERMTVRRLYDAEVRYVDEQVGHFLDTLKSFDLYDSALIILTSDHAEEFWEHGHLGHGHSMHAETIGVPLLIKPPQSTSPRRIDEYVSTQALAPTVMDLLDLDFDRPKDWLSPLAVSSDVGADRRHPDPVISAGTYRFDQKETIIVEGIKTIYSVESGQWTMFDTGQDPLEVQPLDPDEYPAQLQLAKDLLAAHRAKADAIRAGHGVGEQSAPLDPRTLDRLKSLGYIR